MQSPGRAASSEVLNASMVLTLIVRVPHTGGATGAGATLSLAQLPVPGTSSAKMAARREGSIIMNGHRVGDPPHHA
jgi:hypothetical protein